MSSNPDPAVIEAQELVVEVYPYQFGPGARLLLSRDQSGTGIPAGPGRPGVPLLDVVLSRAACQVLIEQLRATLGHASWFDQA